mgnify:FL=1
MRGSEAMRRRKQTVLPLAAVCALALLSLTAVTAAWFTNNAKVNTSRAVSRTAVQSVELQVSSKGGDDFSGGREADIVQVNSAEMTRLMPVSTADLATFVQPPATVDGYAVSFQRVEDERDYYHGRVYLRATADAAESGRKLAVYLDEGAGSGGALAVGGAAGSRLLHAARLGLVFDGKQESAVIFRLSEDKNAEGDRTLNTKLDGAVLEEGSVLTWTGTAAKAVADPAVLTKDRAVGADGTVPEKPLLEMELGRVYQVDVYFYLEGCDPDCTESIAFDDGYLHLAFYGVLC